MWWSNRNHSIHLRVMNQRTRLMGRRGNPPIPRSKEVRILETIQARIPNPITTSMASALTWKAAYLTLGQDNPISLPEQLSKLSNTSEQCTVTSAIHISLLKPCSHSLTHIFLQPFLIWYLRSPTQMQRWLASVRRTSMNPSTKIWGRRMCTSQTCTISKISS